MRGQFRINSPIVNRTREPCVYCTELCAINVGVQECIYHRPKKAAECFGKRMQTSVIVRLNPNQNWQPCASRQILILFFEHVWRSACVCVDVSEWIFK